MEEIEGSWEIRFNTTEESELLLALVVRDLIHGSSYDVDLDAGRGKAEVDYVAGDELDGDACTILVSAQATAAIGQDLQGFTAGLLEELVDEAQDLVARRQELERRTAAEVELRAVPEEEERWDLVVPDWLAPEDAEVPFGFRAFDAKDGRPWPDDAILDRHGRVVVVPWGDELVLYGIPAPQEADVDPRSLPLHPNPR